MKKYFKFNYILKLICIIIVFSLGLFKFSSAVYATDMYVLMNPYHNDATNWGIKMQYMRPNALGNLVAFRPAVYQRIDDGAVSYDNQFQPRAGDAITWHTACVDPTDAADTVPTTYRMDGGVQVYDTVINAGCNYSTKNFKYAGCYHLSSGVNYASSWNVSATAQCPYYDNSWSWCAANGVVHWNKNYSAAWNENNMTCGASHCGGTNNCTYYNKTCSGTSCSHPSTSYSTMCGNGAATGTLGVGNTTPASGAADPIAGTNYCGGSSKYCSPPPPTFNLTTGCSSAKSFVKVDRTNNNQYSDGNYDIIYRKQGAASWTSLCSPTDPQTILNLTDNSTYEVGYRGHTTSGRNGPTNFRYANIDTPADCSLNTLNVSVFKDTATVDGVKQGIEPVFTTAIFKVKVDSGVWVNTASGTHAFTSLSDGAHTVTIDPSTIPSGWAVSTVVPITSTFPPTPQTVYIGLKQVAPSYSISGKVFLDTNKNGKSDEGAGSGCTTCSTGLLSTITYTGPSSGGVDVDASGNYSFTGLAAGTYIITYNGPIPNPYFITYTSSTQVTVGNPASPYCTFAPGYSGSGNCDATNLGSATNVDFGISNSTAWTQCVGGDCLFKNHNFVPNTAGVPNSCGGVTDYASINQTSSGTLPQKSDKGLIIVNPNTFTFCPSSACLALGSVSPTWIIGLDANYTYDGNKFTSFGNISSVYAQNPTPVVLNSDGSYDAAAAVFDSSNNLTLQTTGDLALDSASQFMTTLLPSIIGANANKHVVVLVSGNLTINNNIIIPAANNSNSTLLFAVSGTINLSKDVSRIDGWYSSDHEFIVESKDINGNGGNCSDGSGPDDTLDVQGALTAGALGSNGNIVNKRDLCANSNCPTLRVTQRLDFILNAPVKLSKTDNIWKENTH
jgi:hypothetical protein